MMMQTAAATSTPASPVSGLTGASVVSPAGAVVSAAGADVSTGASVVTGAGAVVSGLLLYPVTTMLSKYASTFLP